MSRMGSHRAQPAAHIPSHRQPSPIWPWSSPAAIVGAALGLLAVLAGCASTVGTTQPTIAAPTPTATVVTTPTLATLKPLAADPGWTAELVLNPSAGGVGNAGAGSVQVVGATITVAGPYAVNLECVGAGTMTVDVEPEFSVKHSCTATPQVEHDEYSILKSAEHVKRTLSVSVTVPGDVAWAVLIEIKA